MELVSRLLAEDAERRRRIEYFFFQAEDGIRLRDVTGVQTCALPIWSERDAPRVLQVRVDRCGTESRPIRNEMRLGKTVHARNDIRGLVARRERCHRQQGRSAQDDSGSDLHVLLLGFAPGSTQGAVTKSAPPEPQRVERKVAIATR